jgi:hypothetical protein
MNIHEQPLSPLKATEANDKIQIKRAAGNEPPEIDASTSATNGQKQFPSLLMGSACYLHRRLHAGPCVCSGRWLSLWHPIFFFYFR